MEALAKSVVFGVPDMVSPHGNPTFKSAKETMSVQVDDDCPNRTVLIGAGLTNK